MSARSLVLTLNAGSSSLKFGVYEATHGLPLLATGQIGGLGTRALLAVTGTSETGTAAGAASVSLTQDLGNADHDEAATRSWDGSNRPMRAPLCRRPAIGWCMAGPITYRRR